MVHKMVGMRVELKENQWVFLMVERMVG